jgi:hypothetical protein
VSELCQNEGKTPNVGLSLVLCMFGLCDFEMSRGVCVCGVHRRIKSTISPLVQLI